MINLPEEILETLRQNAALSRAAAETDADHDPCPVLKLFNPIGSGTWLATEIGEDGDTLFGLADLGFGCPELGYFSLSEIAEVRLPYGLRIERDEDFGSAFKLSTWTAFSRRSGSILWAETLLRRVAAGLEPLPVLDSSD